MSDGKDDANDPKLVTSESLSTKSRVACWALAVALLGSGGAATFFEKPGAAAAALIALGGLLTIIALMGRIPLRLEVAGATLDASYPTPDQAYDAGHDGGVREAIDAVSKEAKALPEGVISRDDLEELLQSLKPPMVDFHPLRRVDLSVSATEVVAESLSAKGWRDPAVCVAARVTRRQLEYWRRTGLVAPTGRSAVTGEELYTLGDVILVATTANLLEMGLSLTVIRNAIASLRRSGADLSEIYLASDGANVFQTSNSDDVNELLAQGQASIVVNMKGIQAGVVAELTAAPGEALASS